MTKGINLYKEARFNEALRYFRSLNVDEDSYTEVSYYLGLCYTQLKQYDEALIYLDQVVAAGVDYAQMYQARMVIGYVYASTERYRLAEFEFQHLLDQGYESSKVHAALGYILFKQGNIPGSIKNLEEALQLNPDNITALNSLAFIMADQDLKIDLARRYVERALLLRPDNPAYLDTYGWVLFKSGDTQQAYNILQKAKHLAPDEAEIQSHLTQVLKTGVVNS